MPNTVRAKARNMPKTTPARNFILDTLDVAEFEVAWAADRARDVNRTDAEAKAADERQRKILKKLAALRSTDIATMRLKARAYMWGEGAYDLEEFSDRQHDPVSGPVLVSLFRDLGVDAPEGAVSGSPAPSSKEPGLLDVSDELSLVVDLIDAAYMASDSLPPSIVGREPLTRLLSLINNKLAAVIDQLDKVRENSAAD